MALLCALLTSGCLVDSGSDRVALVNQSIFVGQVVFEKVPVTELNGLDVSSISEQPVQAARVQAVDTSSGKVLLEVASDAQGRFTLTFPFDRAIDVRVLAESSDRGVVVVDNKNNDAVYSVVHGPIGPDLAPITTEVTLVAADSNRANGPFNLLAVGQAGQQFLRDNVPGLTLPTLTIRWNELNKIQTGDGTFFEPDFNRITVLGDRSVTSDEFDDTVVMHEFGHYVSSNFSRDDSIGGGHSLGDRLLPTVAWSEGFANFFSAFVTGEKRLLDSFGPDVLDVFADFPAGTLVSVVEVEDNSANPDPGGIELETSVASVIFDVADGVVPADEPFDFLDSGFGAVFAVIQQQLPSDTQVCLTDFAEGLVAERPQDAGDLTTILAEEDVVFTANASPSVPIPFPTPVQNGTDISVLIDGNLRPELNSNDAVAFFEFTLQQTTAVNFRLEITDTGLRPETTIIFNIVDATSPPDQSYLESVYVLRPVDDNTELSGVGDIATHSVALTPGTYIGCLVANFFREQSDGSLAENFNNTAVVQVTVEFQ